MVVIACVVVVGILVGSAGVFAGRRWPGQSDAPHIPVPTIRTEVRRHSRVGRVLQGRADSKTLTGLALTAVLGFIAAALVAIGALLVMAHTDTGFARFDQTFAKFGAVHATSASTAFLRDVSQLGGYLGVTIVALVVALVEWRRTRVWAVAAFLFLTVGGQFVVADLVKAIVQRPRPDIHPLTGFSGTSFPSGHATAAAATYMACAFLLSRRRSLNVKATLVGVAAGIAASVAATRVLLGVHWFTDVLAGLALGWAWFAVCSIAFGGSLLHFGAPVAQAETVAEGVGAGAAPDQAASRR